MENLRKTPLAEEHRELGAQMAPFAGWLMPIQYSGILAESRHCREAAALFDTCHMGEFHFYGDPVACGFERVFSCRLETIPVGRGRYGFLLNERGGILDDLVIFRLAPDELMIVVNAGTVEKDFAAIRSRLKGKPVFTDISAETGKLDIQGPMSRDVLKDVCGVDVSAIPYFGFIRTDVFGSRAIVSRTGYTGELGFEIYCTADTVGEYWRRILADGRVRPAGLGARDALRLEMGYCLYGSDIDETTTPLEAGLEQFVDFGKDFIGRDALLGQRERGLSRVRVAFQVSSRRSPRHGYEIYHEDIRVGEVTSGVFSPMLNRGIGMGYVKPEAASIGTSLVIRHESTVMDAEVRELPFFRVGSLRKK